MKFAPILVSALVGAGTLALSSAAAEPRGNLRHNASLVEEGLFEDAFVEDLLTNQTELARHRRLISDYEFEVASKKVVVSLAKKMPVVGTLAGLVFDLFWNPSNDVSVWDQIYADLDAELNARFLTEKYYAKWSTLTSGLNTVMDRDAGTDSYMVKFEDAMRLDDFGKSRSQTLQAGYWLDEMLSKMDDLADAHHFTVHYLHEQMEIDFDQLEINIQLIPASIDFALLHLSLLKDKVNLAPHLYSDFTEADLATYQQDLQDHIVTYFQYFAVMKTYWENWRPQQYTISTEGHDLRAYSCRANGVQKTCCCKKGYEGHIYDDLAGGAWMADTGWSYKNIANTGETHRKVLGCASRDCAEDRAENYVTHTLMVAEKERVQTLWWDQVSAETLGTFLHTTRPGEPGSLCVDDSECTIGTCQGTGSSARCSGPTAVDWTGFGDSEVDGYQYQYRLFHQISNSFLCSGGTETVMTIYGGSACGADGTRIRWDHVATVPALPDCPHVWHRDQGASSPEWTNELFGACGVSPTIAELPTRVPTLSSDGNTVKLVVDHSDPKFSSAGEVLQTDYYGTRCGDDGNSILWYSMEGMDGIAPIHRDDGSFPYDDFLEDYFGECGVSPMAFTLPTIFPDSDAPTH